MRLLVAVVYLSCCTAVPLANANQLPLPGL